VALVTGAAQGIGRAIAERLASDGMSVALNDRARSAELSAAAHATGGLEAVADAADPSAVEAMYAYVAEELGPVDVVVSNHALLTKRALVDSDAQLWWHEVEVNLSGAFFVARAAIPGMVARNQGAIIFISSCWGITGEPLATAYSASKAGLISLARSLARELAPRGIAVNAIAPGVIDTPQLHVDAEAAGRPLEEMRAEFAAMTPMGRIGAPAEVAATVSFLASREARALVGQVLQPNGGLLTCQG
jgi:2-hydroxycyclohexanecarboxyl-CoA dehydrogenase